LATLIVLTVGLCVLAAGVMMSRAERRAERDRRLAYRANE
jgi:hypothetical protein